MSLGPELGVELMMSYFLQQLTFQTKKIQKVAIGGERERFGQFFATQKEHAVSTHGCKDV